MFLTNIITITQEHFNKKSFEKNIRIYHDDLYRFIYSLCLDEHLAMDALQNALIKAFENQEKLKDKGKFKSWIFTIGKRETFSLLRKDKKHQPIEMVEIVSDESIEENFIKEIEATAVGEAIKSLPQKQKEIMALHYYHDMSFEEISKELSVNVNTIRSHHHRGKSNVKEFLSQGGLI